MKMKSKFSLREIKSHIGIYPFLTDNNIYIKTHSFPDYVIDTTSIGWIEGKHPQHHNRNKVVTTMTTEIKAANPDSTVPFFHLAPGSVGRVDNNV